VIGSITVGVARSRLARVILLAAALAVAAVTIGSAGAGAAARPLAHAAAASDPYYVLLLTNVEDNVYIGTESSLASTYACDLPDGGPPPCTTAITYTVQLGPYATCAAATAAYNAAATNPHSAFGGTKVYIFGGSYFIDDMSYWCVPGSSVTTTPTTTTPATTTTTTTSTTGASTAALPPLPTSFCTTAAARIAAAKHAVCAPKKTLSAAAKADARDDLRGELYLTLLFCGGGRNITTNSGEVIDIVTPTFVALCPEIIDMMGYTLTQVHDPSLPDYEQVALLVLHAPPAAPQGTCPSAVSATACTALRKAATGVEVASNYTDEVSVAESLTLDRFAAAVAAQSPSASFLQAALSKVYGGALDYDLARQQKDGRALAKALENAGVDVKVSAAAADQAIAAPTGTTLSTAVLNQLVAGGVAPTAAQARQEIVAQLGTASGTLDSTQVLDTGLPASPIGQPFYTITLSDVEAIVSGLAAQGTVSTASSKTLLGELGAASKACGRSGFSAAVKRFIATADRLPGDAGVIVPYAAGALTASQRPSPCT
jgi:hypothetical protein